MYAVFQKAFRDSRRTSIGLAIAMGLYALMTVSFYPSILEQEEELNEYLQNAPSGVLEFAYGKSIEEIDIADPGGYIHSQFTIFMLLIVGAILIYQAFNAITNEERNGAMDVLLSLPITRREMFLGRFLNSLVTGLIILTGSYLGFAAGTVAFPSFDVDLLNMAFGIYSSFLVLLVVAGFAYLVAVFIPSRMKFAGWVAYLFLIGSYLFYSLSLVVEDTEAIRPIFLFYYYHTGDVMNGDINWGGWGLLILVALVYSGLAWWQIDRKEIAV
jgi:ABC-2 type transport system permease protein